MCNWYFIYKSCFCFYWERPWRHLFRFWRRERHWSFHTIWRRGCFISSQKFFFVHGNRRWREQPAEDLRVLCFLWCDSTYTRLEPFNTEHQRIFLHITRKSSKGQLPWTTDEILLKGSQPWLTTSQKFGWELKTESPNVFSSNFDNFKFFFGDKFFYKSKA